MPPACDAGCGRQAEPSLYVELEYPVAGSGDVGSIAGQLCPGCAKAIVRRSPVGALIDIDPVRSESIL